MNFSTTGDITVGLNNVNDSVEPATGLLDLTPLLPVPTQTSEYCDVQASVMSVILVLFVINLKSTLSEMSTCEVQ